MDRVVKLMAAFEHEQEWQSEAARSKFNTVLRVGPPLFQWLNCGVQGLCWRSVWLDH
jgi:hypothetical protein